MPVGWRREDENVCCLLFALLPEQHCAGVCLGLDGRQWPGPNSNGRSFLSTCLCGGLGESLLLEGLGEGVSANSVRHRLRLTKV